MASRWFYRVSDEEMGPVGFQDLVEMIRAGTLTEEDRVRREFAEEWTASREVIGLFRAAQGPAAQTNPSQVEPAPAASEPRANLAEPGGAVPARRPRRWRFPHFGARVWIGLGLGMLVAAILGYEFWSHRKSRIFPESARSKPRPVEKQSFESIRAPRPSIPSVPGLKEGVAALVPGLDHIDPIYSPCLTPDLRTIVYSASIPPGAWYDLFIATREDVSAPFGKPKRIDACCTPNTNVFSTLSPDGLELMYVKFERRQHLFHSVRGTTSDDFKEPKAWSIPRVDPKSERAMRPRFLDPLHVFFMIEDLNAVPHGFFIAERDRPKASFGPFRQVKSSGAIHPMVFVMPGSLRAYFPSEDGLHVLVRPSQDLLGGEEMLIAPIKATGTFDGPIWVAPQEDVVFYVSTGPGKSPKLGPHHEGRKLWMFRF